MFCKSNFRLSVFISGFQYSRYEGCPSARSVCGEHEVKLVVDTHQLTDAGLHDVGEVRVITEDRPVDCNNLSNRK